MSDPEVRKRAQQLVKRMESKAAESSGDAASGEEPVGSQSGGGPSIPLSY